MNRSASSHLSISGLYGSSFDLDSARTGGLGEQSSNCAYLRTVCRDTPTSLAIRRQETPRASRILIRCCMGVGTVISFPSREKPHSTRESNPNGTGPTPPSCQEDETAQSGPINRSTSSRSSGTLTIVHRQLYSTGLFQPSDCLILEWLYQWMYSPARPPASSHVRSSQCPEMHGLDLHATEEPLGRGVVGAAPLRAHGPDQAVPAHPVQPSRPPVMTTAVTVDHGTLAGPQRGGGPDPASCRAGSAFGDVPAVCATTMPSWQSIIGERYTFPSLALIPRGVREPLLVGSFGGEVPVDEVVRRGTRPRPRTSCSAAVRGHGRPARPRA